MQTIYNLLHDLKRFPLSQSEHQAERSRAEARGVLRAGKSSSSPAVPGEGERCEGLLRLRSCCAGNGAVIGVITGVGVFFKTFFGASGARASRSSRWQWGGWEMGSGRARLHPAHPDAVSWESIPNQPRGRLRSWFFRCRGLSGPRAAHGCSETSPTHPQSRPVPSPLRGGGGWDSLCLPQRSKKNYPQLSKALLLSPPPPAPARLHPPLLESPLPRELVPKNYPGGPGGDVGWRQRGGKMQNKACRV